jgi:hypothetical protein
MRIPTAAVVCSLLVTAGCGAKRSLLANGGFERQGSQTMTPADWTPTVVPKTKEFVRFEWDDAVAHSGDRSVSIAISPDHPDDVIHYNWVRSIPGCEAGMSYELTGWIKTENMTGSAWIVVQCWNDARDKMLVISNTAKDHPVKGTSDWTRVKLAFTVPEGTGEVLVRAGVAAPENRSGRAWFDDLRVREID